MRYLTVALALCACVAENPDYRLFPTSADAGEELDLGRPGDPDDLQGGADLLGCQPGERRCGPGEGFRWVSQLCQEGRWRNDRTCPQNAPCTQGYCQRPPPQGSFEGKPCLRENDCFNLQQPNTVYSCQPFVRLPDRVIEGYCATQISRQGTGFPGTQCQPPDGLGCRSGFCDEIGHRTGGRELTFCYRACEVDSDCPQSARYCREAQITVEQIPYRGRSCVPVP